MKGKVGLAIVTYGTNYGTYLQAFATQYFIRNLGYETEIINIDSVKKEVGTARKKYFARQIFNFSEVKSYFPVFIGMARRIFDVRYRTYLDNRKKHFNMFRDKYFSFSEIRESWHGLRELCDENYDHVLVGSDQLWRPANIEGDFYTLNFVSDKINKIAYATSFGLPNIRKNQTLKAKRFLTRISHLSVREESGARIVKSLTQRDIPVVCDPTLLVAKNEWAQFVDDTPLIKEKYVLCYFLGNNKKHRRFAEKLAEHTGCRLVGVLHVAGFVSADKNFKGIVPSGIGPFEFLNLVQNAEYVCTDSFHGCVFTAIFNRRLFAFNRFANNSKMSTNGRLTTLLDSLELERSLVSGDEDIENALQRFVDFEKVEKNIAKKRTQSELYLRKAFDNENTDFA